MQESQRKINLPNIIAAVLAILLQIILAPAMTIGAAMPNFIAAYVLCATLNGTTSRPVILAFVLGFVFDLIGSGPVGAMAFCLIIAAAASSAVYKNLSNSSWLSALLIMVVAFLLIELVYGIIMLVTGMADGFGSALIHRILPCTLYDCVIGAIMYPIVSRLMVQQSSSSPDSIPIIG